MFILLLSFISFYTDYVLGSGEIAGTVLALLAKSHFYGRMRPDMLY